MAQVNQEQMLARIEAATAACLQAMERCREEARAARETLADLRRERREIHQDIQTRMGKVIEASLKQELNIVAVHIKRVTDEATSKVFARFDKISAILMGLHDPDGSLEELTARTVEQIKAIREI